MAGLLDINVNAWSRMGLASDGSAWIVKNKFAKAVDMKPLKARWNPDFGWYFKEKHDDTFYMSATDLGSFDSDGIWHLADNIYRIIDKIRESFIPKTDSNYIGDVGQYVSLDDAIFTSCKSFKSSFNGYSYDTVYVYIFKVNDDKDTVIWKTGQDIDFEDGKFYTIKGKVKDHNEYCGDKQTILTRCKVSES